LTRPPVSVLLPARDEAATIAQALADLQNQTHPALEIIVVDDGSRDATAAIVETMARTDTRIRLLRQDARGIVAALNMALGEAHGRFIARMDADDRCAPERLARQVALLHARPEIACASCLIAPPRGEAWAGGYREYARWVNALREPADIARERFVECPLVHPTMLWRREALEALGGWRAGDFPEDYDQVLRLHAAGYAAAKVATPLYFWRDRAQRASRVDPRYRPEAFAALKAKYLTEGPLAEKSEVVVWGAGKTSRRLVRPLQRLGVRVIAWLDIDPRKIGRVHAGAPVIDAAQVGAYRAWPLLAYVGRRGARELIRPRLQAAGFTEGRDAWFCA